MSIFLSSSNRRMEMGRDVKVKIQDTKSPISCGFCPLPSRVRSVVYQEGSSESNAGTGIPAEPTQKYLKTFDSKHHWIIGYSDYDVFLETDEGSRVYRCKKLF